MAEKLKILLLEDNPADIELIKRALRNMEFELSVHIADTRDDFVSAIQDFIPDIVLSDHSLPQFNSLEALRLAKEYLPGIPFLLVTGAVSEEFAVQVINAGADDYILKDRLARLPMAIRNSLQKKLAEKERKEMIEQLLTTNSELNTFLYKATHDLRGPLTSIMGLTNLAINEENDTQARSYVRLISECTIKLDEILISLINTMGIKNARLECNEVDLGKMIDRILKRIEFMPGFARVVISVKISGQQKLFTDEKILNSVLQNLVENAIKYQDFARTDPMLEIIITDSANGKHILISDNGIGISEDIHDMIFDMFYRANESTKGSGLGLYLVKNGMRRLGGNITLKSEKGKGTSFELHIPSVPAGEE